VKKTLLTFFILFLAASLFGSDMEERVRLSDWRILGPMNFAPKENVSSVPFMFDETAYESVGLCYRFFSEKDLALFDYESQDNSIHLEYDTTAFSDAYEALGFQGILSSYYCYCDAVSDSPGVRIVYAGGTSSFYVDSVKYPGDPYDKKRIFVPAFFGKNSRIALSLGGYFGYADSEIKVYEPPHEIFFNDSFYTTFDIVADSLMSGYVSVQIINAGDSAAAVSISGSDGDSTFSFERRNVILPYLGIKNVSLFVKTKRRLSSGDRPFLFINIESSGEMRTESLSLRVKDLLSPRKETYLSKTDSSVQYYAILLPEKFSESASFPLVMSLHGAGVRAEGQAEAYRRRENTIILCPTNRGEFGFDWQDFGRIDFLEAFEKAKERYCIEKERVSLTGHSMGGHGTMYLGAVYADLFSSIIPASGWINFNTYTPSSLSRLALFDNEDVRQAVNLIKDSENPLSYIGNLTNTPVLLVHGEKDDNVPVFQSRVFYNELKRVGIACELHEYPDKGHWFDIEETPGIDCIDSDEMKSFAERFKKDSFSRKNVFSTFSLFVNDSADMIRIDRQDKKYYKSTVEAEIKLGEILVRTSNVEGFSLCGINAAYNEKIKTIIDGKILYVKPSESVSFVKKNGEFKKAEKPAENNDYSLINYAFFNPFTIVYSTDSLINDITFYQAIYIHNLFSTKCIGDCSIVPDTLFDDKSRKNVIFIGVPDIESPAWKVFDCMKVGIDEKKISDGEREYDVKGFSYVCCKKNKKGLLTVLFAGQNREAQRTSTFFLPFSSGTYMTEYMLFDETVKSEGYNGLKNAEFY